ncbi:MAG: hypothetical protein ACHQ50_03975 [Fimbriimonadales bacterium]
MRPAAVFFLFACFWASAYGQPVVISGDAGFNADSPYNRLYNTRTVVTFSGRVAGVTVAAPLEGMGNAVTILVKTAKGETWHVDVGPEWYVNNQRTRILIKDEVRVTGSRVKIDGLDAILAEQIVKAKSVLALRRPSGRPYWDAVSSAPQDGGIEPQTLGGQITKIDTFVDGTNGPVERLNLRTDDGDVLVALGPEWFMRRQSLQLSPGEYVTVSILAPASGQAQRTKPLILFAASLNFQQQRMALRSSNGTPLWYGPDGG